MQPQTRQGPHRMPWKALVVLVISFVVMASAVSNVPTLLDGSTTNRESLNSFGGVSPPHEVMEFMDIFLSSPSFVEMAQNEVTQSGTVATAAQVADVMRHLEAFAYTFFPSTYAVPDSVYETLSSLVLLRVPDCLLHTKITAGRSSNIMSMDAYGASTRLHNMFVYESICTILHRIDTGTLYSILHTKMLDASVRNFAPSNDAEELLHHYLYVPQYRNLIDAAAEDIQRAAMVARDPEPRTVAVLTQRIRSFVQDRFPKNAPTSTEVVRAFVSLLLARVPTCMHPRPLGDGNANLSNPSIIEIPASGMYSLDEKLNSNAMYEQLCWELCENERQAFKPSTGSVVNVGSSDADATSGYSGSVIEVTTGSSGEDGSTTSSMQGQGSVARTSSAPKLTGLNIALMVSLGIALMALAALSLMLLRRNIGENSEENTRFGKDLNASLYHEMKSEC